MKLINTGKSDNWRDTFKETVQVDYTPIPTGETYTEEDEDGVEHTRMETVERPAFGFQTERGRGKGVQWIPVEDVDGSLEALQYYAEHGVEAVDVSEDWLSPSETIHETITRVPSRDANGNKIEGEYDIAFRTRMGRGSKSCRVPEKDFPEFVRTLTETSEAVPEALKRLEEKRAAAMAKAAESDDSSDE